MYTVYVLYSISKGKHYTGFTSDFESRFLSHNELGTKGWTVGYRPWIIILQETFTDKRLALEREKWLKSGTGRDFVARLVH